MPDDKITVTIDKEFFCSRQFWVSFCATAAGIAGFLGYDIGDSDKWVANGAMIVSGVVGIIGLVHGVKGIRRPAERITSVAGVPLKGLTKKDDEAKDHPLAG